MQTSLITKKTGYIGGRGFDRLMAILGLLFISGVYLDGWAHSHGLVDKTFFTPWHAVLYSGYAINAFILVATLFINHTRGRSWLVALPDGYELSLLGVPVFLLAGVGDLIWHTLFGFEVGIAPLLSPTHLALAFGATLIVSGPLRATWRYTEKSFTDNWSNLLPAVIALLALLSVFTFFTEFANPYVHTYEVTSRPYRDSNGAKGAADILLQAGIMMGVILFAIRRWRLPFGSLTLLFTVNSAFMSVFNDHYAFIPFFAAVGLIADLLYQRLQPTEQRLDALRGFAFTVPVITYLSYFAAVELIFGPITWTIHLWLGVTVMAGIEGLLLSYLMIPSQSTRD